MRIVWALARKDLLLLSRDRGGIFFTFVFPLLFAVVFGAIFENLTGVRRGRVPMVLVDEDQSAESRAFVQRLMDSPNVGPDLLPRAEALKRVRQGNRPVCVILPAGFGAALAQRPLGPVPQVEIGIDPARRAEAMLVQGALMRHMVDELRREFPSMERFEPVSFQSIDIGIDRAAPKNFYAVSFPQGMMWGVIGCTAAAGVSIVVERRRGMLRRMRIAPVTLTQVLAGKAVASLVLCCAVLAMLVLFGWLAFDVVPRRADLVALAIVSTAVAFVGLTILLSLFARSELSAIAVCWGVLLLFSMVGGGMVPFMAMPAWLRAIGTVSPVRWALQALDGAIWRQYSASEIVLPCLVLWAMGLVCFVIGVLGFRRMERA